MRSIGSLREPSLYQRYSTSLVELVRTKCNNWLDSHKSGSYEKRRELTDFSLISGLIEFVSFRRMINEECSFGFDVHEEYDLSQYVEFDFWNQELLSDGVIEIRLVETTPVDIEKGWVPNYAFSIHMAEEEREIGQIRFRAGDSEQIFRAAGHIGYQIDEEFRGNEFATKAAQLSLEVARFHGFKEVILTCQEDNPASIRVIQKMGGIHLETVPLQKHYDMYQRGLRQVMRWVVPLN